MALTAEERSRIQARLGTTALANTIDFEPEVDFQPEDVPSPVPPSRTQPFYEQAAQQTEQQIAERPSSIDYVRQVVQDPSMIQQHPFRTGLSVMNAPFEAGESIPANIGLALQRGNLSRLPQDMLRSFQGQRPAEMGDIYRASGVPALQAMAAPAGLLLTGGIGEIRATSRLTQPAIKLADAIRLTTSVPARVTHQVLGQVPKIAEKIGDVTTRPLRRTIEPIAEFPYRKSLEVRQGLVQKFRELNTWYGDQLEKLSTGLQGVIPTQQLLPAFQRRLQEVGLLDQTGNVVADQLGSMNRIEQQILQTYEDLATSPNPTVPFNDVIGRIKELRKMIRAQARQKNVAINQDERLVSGVLHEVAQLIQPNVQGKASQSLLDINTTYAQQRQILDLGNRIFKLFKGELDTKSGERVMTNYYQVAADQGTARLLQQIEHLAGVPFIQQAKARSAITDILKFPGLAPSLRSARGMGRLMGTMGKEIAGAPFNAPGQVQQAVVRELLRITSQPKPRRQTTTSPTLQ